MIYFGRFRFLRSPPQDYPGLPGLPGITPDYPEISEPRNTSSPGCCSMWAFCSLILACAHGAAATDASAHSAELVLNHAVRAAVQGYTDAIAGFDVISNAHRVAAEDCTLRAVAVSNKAFYTAVASKAVQAWAGPSACAALDAVSEPLLRSGGFLHLIEQLATHKEDPAALFAVLTAGADSVLMAADAILTEYRSNSIPLPLEECLAAPCAIRNFVKQSARHDVLVDAYNITFTFGEADIECSGVLAGGQQATQLAKLKGQIEALGSELAEAERQEAELEKEIAALSIDKAVLETKQREMRVSELEGTNEMEGRLTEARRQLSAARAAAAKAKNQTEKVQSQLPKAREAAARGYIFKKELAGLFEGFAAGSRLGPVAFQGLLADMAAMASAPEGTTPGEQREAARSALRRFKTSARGEPGCGANVMELVETILRLDATNLLYDPPPPLPPVSAAWLPLIGYFGRLLRTWHVLGVVSLEVIVEGRRELELLNPDTAPRMKEILSGLSKAEKYTHTLLPLADAAASFAEMGTAATIALFVPLCVVVVLFSVCWPCCCFCACNPFCSLRTRRKHTFCPKFGLDYISVAWAPILCKVCMPDGSLIAEILFGAFLLLRTLQIMLKESSLLEGVPIMVFLAASVIFGILYWVNQMMASYFGSYGEVIFWIFLLGTPTIMKYTS